MEQAPEGLRQRKKEKTRHQIERTILELSLERGYENVTVEDVCAQCDISKKTFFNYYASKEAALLGQREAAPDGASLGNMLEESLAAARAHPTACRWNYLDVLVTGLQSSFNVTEGREEIVQLRKEVLAERPQLFFSPHRSVSGLQQSVADSVRAFLERHPDCRLLSERTLGEETVVAVSAVMNIMRTRAILSIHGDHVLTAKETRKLVLRFLAD